MLNSVGEQDTQHIYPDYVLTQKEKRISKCRNFVDYLSQRIKVSITINGTNWFHMPSAMKEYVSLIVGKGNNCNLFCISESKKFIRNGYKCYTYFILMACICCLINNLKER